jgi:hypothetical protein
MRTGRAWSMVVLLLVSATALGGESAASLIRVPDITGGANGCVTDVNAILKPLGLRSKEIAIHGPIDPDAKDIGCAYRQAPKAGTMVRKGTVVKYRSWWESQ